ncbi:hypothetical protein [Streptomyces sp. NPDC059455]|uniref:hypothetical protein n=1 Tax=Streptomyces sp. NPDC059455 TaxID=3346837 RepID=UPI0036C1A962
MRWRKDFTSGKLTIERLCLITSLPPGMATGPQLAAWIRGHRHSRFSPTFFRIRRAPEVLMATSW